MSPQLAREAYELHARLAQLEGHPVYLGYYVDPALMGRIQRLLLRVGADVERRQPKEEHQCTPA